MLIDFKFRPDTIKTGNTNSRIKSIVDYFYGDSSNKLPKQKDLNLLDKLFDEYSEVMNHMFKKMRKRYNTFLNKFLTEK